jgi:CheY-like chemotaxis protein
MRALVVEDDALICMLIESFLGELGCNVVASAARLDDGVVKAQTLAIDVAVLDINLDSQLSYPIALILKDREIPFVFATGYGKVPELFKGVPVVAKPFDIEDLKQSLLRATTVPLA